MDRQYITNPNVVFTSLYRILSTNSLFEMICFPSYHLIVIKNKTSNGAWFFGVCLAKKNNYFFIKNSFFFAILFLVENRETERDSHSTSNKLILNERKKCWFWLRSNIKSAFPLRMWLNQCDANRNNIQTVSKCNAPELNTLIEHAACNIAAEQHSDVRSTATIKFQFSISSVCFECKTYKIWNSNFK